MGAYSACRLPQCGGACLTLSAWVHGQAKQRHHMYLAKQMEHVHTTQSAAADRFAAFCMCLGFGGLHGGHWIFLAAKSRAARAKTHIGDPSQPRVAQVVPRAAGQEIAVFVEPPPARVGCALCGKAVACDPCGIDFSVGPQAVPCDHAFCRHCLEAELAVTWGCPTCGDNPVWKFETRWKGLKDVVEPRDAVADEIAALRCHCRHGCRCAWGDTRHEHTVDMPVELSTERQAQMRAELLALRKLGEALGPPGGETERHHRKALMARLAVVDNLEGVNTGQRRRLLQQHAQEVDQLLATRHTELGWTANDDGCGAVVPLGNRRDHQKHCYKAVAYETACIRHTALYWVVNTAFILLWALFLLPELWHCQDDTSAALRSEGYSGPVSDQLAEKECRVWTRWDFHHAAGWVVQLVLGCISLTHWALDLLMIQMHASSIARQQRLRLLPDLSTRCGISQGESWCGCVDMCLQVRLAESWSFVIIFFFGGGIGGLWAVWDLGFL